MDGNQNIIMIGIVIIAELEEMVLERIRPVSM